MYIKQSFLNFLENEVVQENQAMSQSEDRKVSFDNVPTYFYYLSEEVASPRHRREQLVKKRNDPAFIRYQRGEEDRFGSFNKRCASLYIPNIGH